MAIKRRTLGRTGADVTILGHGAMELSGLPRGPQIAARHLTGNIALAERGPLPDDLYTEAKKRLRPADA